MWVLGGGGGEEKGWEVVKREDREFRLSFFGRGACILVFHFGECKGKEVCNSTHIHLVVHNHPCFWHHYL